MPWALGLNPERETNKFNLRLSAVEKIGEYFLRFLQVALADFCCACTLGILGLAVLFARVWLLWCVWYGKVMFLFARHKEESG